MLLDKQANQQSHKKQQISLVKVRRFSITTAHMFEHTERMGDCLCEKHGMPQFIDGKENSSICHTKSTCIMHQRSGHMAYVRILDNDNNIHHE